MLRAAPQLVCPDRIERPRLRLERCKTHAVAWVRAGEAVGEVEGLGFAQSDGDAQEDFAGAWAEHAGNLVLLYVEAVLIEPALRAAGVHHVERDRQRVGRELGVDVAVGAVVEQLAGLESRALDEAQAGRLADRARDALVVVFP